MKAWIASLWHRRPSPKHMRRRSPRHMEPRPSRRSREWWALSVVLLVIAAGLLTMGLRSDEAPIAGPPPSPAPVEPELAAPPAANGNALTPSGASGPAVSASPPVALDIPAIGVAKSLSSLGLNPDGTVEVPTNFQEPGWFRLGASPGQVGSAVILGHVDSYEGPAVFFRLQSLQEGDEIQVTLADGVVAHFVVDKVAIYPKDQFPARQVYGSDDDRSLQLVTCGGEFDTQSRSYLSNVVAYSSLVGTTPSSSDEVRRSR